MKFFRYFVNLPAFILLLTLYILSSAIRSYIFDPIFKDHEATALYFWQWPSWRKVKTLFPNKEWITNDPK